MDSKYKHCSRCNITKDISNFYTSKSQSGGFSSMCKECDRKRKLEKYRTKEGYICSIYIGQKNRRSVLYTKEELIEWALKQKEFHILFDNWIKSKYNTMKAPSIDRTNPNLNYSFDNIKLMTWEENKSKGYSDRKSGIDTRTAKTIACYCPYSGELISIYNGINIAARELKISRENIKNSLIRGHVESKVRVWKYVDLQ